MMCKFPLKLVFAAIVACLITLGSRGQTNLLLNGSFEDINTCAEYDAECGVEAWFYLQDVKAQMLPIVDSPEVYGNNSFGLYFQWQNHTGFTPLIGSFLPCQLQAGEIYLFTGILSAQLNPRLNLKLAVVTGDKFYVPGRAFSKAMQPDTITNLSPLGKSGLYQFMYQFTATGKERYLTLGTFISQDTVAMKGELTGSRSVNIVLDNFRLKPATGTAAPCPGYGQRKAAVYAYNFRHKKMDYSLFAKGEVDIDFSRPYPETSTQPLEPAAPDTLILGDVLFDLDKATLKSNAIRVLKDFFGAAVNTNPIDSLYIEGHTDSLGSDSYNLQLSLERCMSVRSWLLDERIVDTQAIQVHPYGESRPIASNATAAGRSMNRRVELLVFRKVTGKPGEE